MLFNPLIASENIKAGYIDYITTSFHFADQSLDDQFAQQLKASGMVAKGPYLEVSGSYQSSKSIKELIAEKRISPLFADLEKCPEDKKELKVVRALYTHQEKAFEKIKGGANVIVTTGTGSGKTECFLVPMINYLLEKIENRSLQDAINAIIIYPMNALANDQMKRMRKILKDCPEIRFGLYNGNTEYTKQKGLSEYRKTHKNDKDFPEPLKNEVLSREEMQERPPHILITNYSMMEYILLRPQDDALFRGAQLRFIVLDEAHIYRGATGIETSLLLRRMEARIPNAGKVQFILTSATLGGRGDNKQIIQFGENLCGVPFEEDNIIRSIEKHIPQEDTREYPNKLWLELDDPEKDPKSVLKQYNADLSTSNSLNEKLAALCLNSRLYAVMRNAASFPRTVNELREQINMEMPISQDELVAFINVGSQAERGGTELFKVKYHYFIRALEGAYASLGSEKRLFLNRTTETVINGKEQYVFEIAVCTDCGRIAIAGKIEDNKIVQYSSRTDLDNADFFIIRNKEDQGWFGEEEEAGEDDYVVCAECGSCTSDKGDKQRMPCDHPKESWIRVHKLKKMDSGRVRCPACGNGHMRRLYVGSDAATSVLATEMYEQMPQEEIVRVEPKAVEKPTRSFFGVTPASHTTKKEKVRQFLSFSDSRSEAAFFAVYMGKSYEEFLRRRGIWHVAEKLRSQHRYEVSVREFAEELTDYLEVNKSFLDWDHQEERGRPNARRNAWMAIMNEIYNARRSTGLISMGVFSIQYRHNVEAARQLAGALEKQTPIKDVQTLLDLLILDAVYSGAIESKEEKLNEAQREYVFYSTVQRKLVKIKDNEKARKKYLVGWCGRKRPNGNLYPNTKIQRIKTNLGLSEAEADELLGQYWDGIISELNDHREEATIDVNDFTILLYPFEERPFYRCKRCGKVTPYNIADRCTNIRCNGTLEPYDALKASENNHFARLYRSQQMKPLYIKEHTAQLSKDQQTKYQEAFVSQMINALSCSTTFEMGVDVGTLETVYLRDIPPNPANYVQRAGRAGRSKGSAAFVLSFAKLSSHDFTYYAHPEGMISGKISAPVFSLANEKIIRRHIYAIVLSYFLKQCPEVYDHDNRSKFLLEGGYEQLCDLLAEKPEDLKMLLKASIPEKLHQDFQINSFGWTEQFIGENGVLSMAVEGFHESIREIEKEITSNQRKHNLQAAAALEKQLKIFRAGKEDGQSPRSLIDFWVRNNVLPKYGFPVDTVELHTDGKYGQDDDKRLNLSRDLQMAIAEYAPGCEVVADGKLLKSRYIRKLPGKRDWEYGYFAKCANCGQDNFSKLPIAADGRPCISCRTKISARKWAKTLEPRMGFTTDGKENEVPLRKPERDYKTDDYYVGDQTRKIIEQQCFQINGKKALLFSTTNDSLVVVGDSEYYVCRICGYADENEIPVPHKNPSGFDCSYNSSNVPLKVKLSHDFKTDVVKIHFLDGRARDRYLMLSVMYALLEGLSRSMGIERNDIKGCLHLETTEIGLIHTLILYDSVAGGAGHVRRMVTSDGKSFMQVINTAIDLLGECKCSTSCYNCLRNYYNQKVHDYLSRTAALDFLKSWQGELVKLDIHQVDNLGDEEMNEAYRVETMGDTISAYGSWQELAESLSLEQNLKSWDDAGIDCKGDLGATIRVADRTYEAFVWWDDEKVAVFAEEDPDRDAICQDAGIRVVCISATAADILKAIEEGNE